MAESRPDAIALDGQLRTMAMAGPPSTFTKSEHNQPNAVFGVAMLL
ncbi:MAG: hypothetical protein M9932_02390 [Xanthobacteraceae bacterium]|nr:hypothetical protein [Xanthobacteraceae bacterium]